MKTELRITHGGKTYEVELNDENGSFRVWTGETHISAPSYADLERKIRKLKTRFELPFTAVTADGVMDGTVTGFHAINGNMLVKWADGSHEQMPGYSYDASSMPRLSDEDTAKAKQLVQARNEAVQALDTFIKARRFESLKKAALEAQDKAVNG